MKSEVEGRVVGADLAPNIIVLALCLGLMTGWGEVLVLSLHRHIGHRWLQISQHYIWMAPSVNAVIFAAAGGLLAITSALLPRVMTWRVAFGILAFGGFVVLLLRNPWIHWGASLLIAAGLAVQTLRLVAHRGAGLQRFLPRAMTVLAVMTAVIAGAMLLYPGWRERRALRGIEAREGTPNVLLLVLDTVRALELSLYGYNRPTTPNIDRWAEAGVVMDRALSTTSWTLPSHASLFTGKKASELDVGWEAPLPATPTTLSETLGAMGYATAGFVGNRMFCSWETGLGRGFMHYEDYPVSRREALRTSYLGSRLYGLASQWAGLPDLNSRIWSAGVNQAALSWIDKSRAKPFFVFLNYLDAHEPYSAPEPYRTRFGPRVRGTPIRPTSEHPVISEADVAPWKNAYDGALVYLDEQIGALFEELKKRGLLDNTLVILTSDHGEEFGEHGVRGHAVSLYQPSVHVPLVFWFPGRVPAGRRISGPASIEDIPATILDLIGRKDHSLSGRSLAPRWLPGADSAAGSDTLVAYLQKVPNAENFFPAARGDIVSVAAGGFRYIWYPTDNKEELFDFGRDVWETTNLAGTPEGRAQLPSFRAAAERILTSRREQ